MQCVTLGAGAVLLLCVIAAGLLSAAGVLLSAFGGKTGNKKGGKHDSGY